MKKLNVLSLFNGISCGRVALERAEIPVNKYISYEIDDNANMVAKDNYPDDEYLGDVFEADFSQYDDIDLLIGGSPCTYWSIAKGGDNRECTSSGLGWDLFSQYVRALKEVHPKWFLYENNESMSDDIKNEITKALGVEPIMINSENFSAQIRKRYYWTNIPFDKEIPNKNLYIEDIIYDDTYQVKDFKKYKDTMIISKDHKSVKWDSSGKGYYSQQNRARTKDSKMNTVTARGRDKCNIWLGDTKYRYLHPVEAERLQTLPDDYTSILKSDSQRIKCIGNGWTVDVIAYIFSYLKQCIDLY